MRADPAKIVPLSESSLLVEFGREISLSLNERALALAEYLDANPFFGYRESVPAYASTAVFYDPVEIVRAGDSTPTTAFHIAAAHVESILSEIGAISRTEGRSVTIPVSFSKEDALDLSAISDKSHLSNDAVIELFMSVEYRVFMLGFLPGFGYMGEVDPKIAMPRRDKPRLKTPKGSIGIAGQQTGIYPFDSPGGWQIIGRTDVDMFDPRSDPPCLLRPGDRVRFVPV